MKPTPPIVDSLAPVSFQVSDSGDGVHTVKVGAYEDFTRLLDKDHFLNRPEYIFRGHRDPSWTLLPTLYRRIASELRANATTEEHLTAKKEAGERTANVLKHFLYGLRGTEWHDEKHELLIRWFEAQKGRSVHINELRAVSQHDPELWASLLNAWALGQHQRLWTPLLDWTASPLVAFYFAFYEADERDDGDESRVVFALNRKLVDERCRHKNFEHDRLECFTPYSRQNPRLIAQQGYFTYSHTYESVESWVRKAFQGETNKAVLIRILITNVKTEQAMRWLNRHGISDRTLFPDLEGITRFTNRAFEDRDLDHL